MTTIARAPEQVSNPTSPPFTDVIGGVDTHADTHTAAVVDAAGRLLGSAQFPTTAVGYRALLGGLRGFGQLVLVGIEGTGVYGAGLARFLAEQGVAMVEVDRPDRKVRRFAGKSDPIDAEAAARSALSGRQSGTPKNRGGAVEALRVLRVARRAAVAHRADVQRRLHALVVTAPETLRAPTGPACSAACPPGSPPPRSRCGPRGAPSRCARCSSRARTCAPPAPASATRPRPPSTPCDCSPAVTTP